MLLHEELFLLAINEQKGRIYQSVEPQLLYGLSGAILSELVLAGKIGIDDKKHLISLDPNPTGEALLDEALQKINEKQRQRKSSYWVSHLAEGLKKLQSRVGKSLVEKRILTREEKRFLWVIPYEEYPQIDASAKYWIKQNLRTLVLTQAEGKSHEVALLGLVRASNLLEFVFTTDELKIARKKIDQLTIKDEIGNGVRETIDAIEAASLAAATAASQS
jgi:hypothetical protein